jgi:hemolysin-activating ACP:hemolysin acyltransferase
LSNCFHCFVISSHLFKIITIVVVLMVVFFFYAKITVKPLTVKIVNAISRLAADRRYEIQCESVGSRPNAIITWYKGKRQLRRAKVRAFRAFVAFIRVHKKHNDN